MHKKALTVAIAGALAAPMAAQAVDFTISGQINRALVVTDNDAGTTATVRDNFGSSSRIRAAGTSELEGGASVTIQFEYEVGGNHDKGARHASGAGVPVSGSGPDSLDEGAGGTGVNLRHANIKYSGSFGGVTLGQGSEAGDASQYSDTTGVVGIGHGSIGTMGSYFGSLDSGGRVNMVRYDTPAIGPVSAAVSVANGDRVSGLLALSTEVAGSSFGAKLGILQIGSAKRSGASAGFSSIGASFGATLASGLTVSGAWARGSDMAGMMTEDTLAEYANVWTAGIPAGGQDSEKVYRYAVKKDGETSYIFSHSDQDPMHEDEADATALLDIMTGVAIGEGYKFATAGGDVKAFDDEAIRLQGLIKTGDAAGASAEERAEAAQAAENLNKLLTDFKCTASKDPTVKGSKEITYGACGSRLSSEKSDGMAYMVDPSYFQVEVGYKFGNTGVAVSWYQSKDFVMEGSEGTAIGLGARHTFPKAGADIYAAVENFSVTPTAGAKSKSGTVFMLGTKVWF